MNNKILKISVLSSLIPFAVAANISNIDNTMQLTQVQLTQMQLTQVQAKLEGQSQLSTQFIIKYKNTNAPEFSLMGNEPTLSLPVSARSFAKSFRSKLNKETRYVRQMSMAGLHVVKVDGKLSARQTQQYMQEMMASGNVDYIEIDQMLQPFAVPNDPQYGNQWHYYEATGGLNLPQAWDKVTGAGVTVAVIDTGYRPHVDLNDNLLPGYDMISNTFVANDGDGRDNDARDPGDATAQGECSATSSARSSSWHGTHVAGTVAAVTDNGEGVAGVAYGAKIIPIRALGKCGGLTSDIADSIIWASGGSVSGTTANANPADVINLSLGGTGSCSATTQTAINQARANGSTLVIAAGNSNDNSTNYNPGNCTGVVNVASTGRDGGRAYYSNYGNNIDVAAPGGAMNSANDPSGVLSTYNTGSNGPVNDSYSYSQGTSMAAPHVAGVAALIKQAKPDATPDEVESILKTTTRSFPATCNNCGSGIVDALAAVNEAIGTTAPPAGDDVLQDGVAKTGLSGARLSTQFYTIDIPTGATNVTFTMSGGSGDADLYVRAGSQPTTSSYDCRPYEAGNNETCSIDNPASGTFYVMLRGYSAFSGVSLVANITGGDTGGGDGGTGGGAGGGTVADVSGDRGAWNRYTLNVPAGMSTFTVTMSGGSGDADMYVRFGSQATLQNYDCRPYRSGNNETCTFSSPEAGTWHINIYGYRAYSGVTIEVEYQP